MLIAGMCFLIIGFVVSLIPLRSILWLKDGKVWLPSPNASGENIIYKKEQLRKYWVGFIAVIIVYSPLVILCWSTSIYCFAFRR